MNESGSCTTIMVLLMEQDAAIYQNLQHSRTCADQIHWQDHIAALGGVNCTVRCKALSCAEVAMRWSIFQSQDCRYELLYTQG